MSRSETIKEKNIDKSFEYYIVQTIDRMIIIQKTILSVYENYTYQNFFDDKHYKIIINHIRVCLLEIFYSNFFYDYTCAFCFLITRVYLVIKEILFDIIIHAIKLISVIALKKLILLVNDCRLFDFLFIGKFK